MTIEREPARLSSGLAVGAAFVAVGAAAIGSVLALLAGVLGFGLFILGLSRNSRRQINLGAIGLFLAALLAGLQQTPVEVLLVAVVAGVLAWDFGRNAIAIGNQLGRDAETRRLEAVQALASGLVGVGSAAIGYGIFQTVGGGKPIAALVLLLLAVVLLGGVLR